MNFSPEVSNPFIRNLPAFIVCLNFTPAKVVIYQDLADIRHTALNL